MLPNSVTLSPQILGMLSEKPSLLEMIGYQVNGLVVVFTALGSIWLLLEVIGFFFKRADARAREQAKRVHVEAARSPGEAPLEGDADLATVVAIAAAVAHVVGPRHRIVAVTPAVDHDWAREGRRQIFSSHQVR
jgi:hypothetical protein